MRRISLKGVLVGGVVDIVATAVALIPLIAVAMACVDAAALPEAQRTGALLEVLNATPALFAAGLLLGSLCSVLGGYVAARIAGRAEVLNGALSAFLCLGFSLYALTTGDGAASPAQHVAYIALSPALGALGGYLRHLRARSARPDAVTPAPTA
jgi:hypothetical protein